MLTAFCKDSAMKDFRNLQLSWSSSRKINTFVVEIIEMFFKKIKPHQKYSVKYHLKGRNEIPESVLSQSECRDISTLYLGLGRLLAFTMIQPYLFIEDFVPSLVILKTILGTAIQFTDFSDFGQEYAAVKHVVEKRHDGSKSLKDLLPSEIVENILKQGKYANEWNIILNAMVSEDNKIALIKQFVTRYMMLDNEEELELLLSGIYQFLPSLPTVRDLLDDFELTCLFVGTKIIHPEFVIYNNTTENNTLSEQNMIQWFWEYVFDSFDPATMMENLRVCWLSKKSLGLKNDLMYYSPIPIINRDFTLHNEIIFLPEEHEVKIGSFQTREKLFECLQHHIDQNQVRRRSSVGSNSPRTPRSVAGPTATESVFK